MKEIHPWYWGYLGKISKINGEPNYIVQGNFKKLNDEQIEITELPPTYWPYEFKQKVEKLIES